MIRHIDHTARIRDRQRRIKPPVQSAALPGSGGSAGGGAGGGTAVQMFKVVSVAADYLFCHTWDGTTEGDEAIVVALPPLQRRTWFDGLVRNGTTYNYRSNVKRVASTELATWTETIYDLWLPGDVVFAVREVTGGVALEVDGEPVDWQVLNVSARHWRAGQRTGNLIVGGNFDQPENHIGSWDGTEWFGLESGAETIVTSLYAHNGRLYAGGYFDAIGGVYSARVAMWDGQRWSPMVGVPGGTYDNVLAVGSYGDDIIVGGADLHFGYFSAGIMAWDGSGWYQLDYGLWRGTLAGSCQSMCEYDGKLIAGGEFSRAGSATVENVAQWDGASWSAMGDGLDNLVKGLIVIDGTLYAVGNFNHSGSTTVRGVARWTGSAWVEVAGGLGEGTAQAATSWNGKLVVAGNFRLADGGPGEFVAAYDPVTDEWEQIGGGLHNRCYAACVSPSGNLVIGGIFGLLADGGVGTNLVEFDGVAWRSIGWGCNEKIYALASYTERPSPPMAPTSLVVTQTASGTILVTAQYNRGVDPDPADTWQVEVFNKSTGLGGSEATEAFAADPVVYLSTSISSEFWVVGDELEVTVTVVRSRDDVPSSPAVDTITLIE